MKRRKLVKDAVPFLPDKHIEEEANLLLAEFGRDRGVVTAPPVPIGDIIELQLKLQFEIDDLCARLGKDDVLGAIFFDTHQILVDTHLDPVANPAMLGRYNFTLAHEVAHWRLHRKHLATDRSQHPLFDRYGRPSFVCRASARPPEEIQADRFAAYLLMPRGLIVPAWEQWRGNLDPVCVLDLEVPLVTADSKTDQTIAMTRFCKPLADRFEVSAEAMRIRLEQLELVVRERANLLF